MGGAAATAGVILCGGRSSRMGGGDKCLLPLGRRAILDAVIDRAARQVGSLAISANGDTSRFARFELPVLRDPIPDYAGPLAGILAGLRWAANIEGCERLASFAGDTPFFPPDLVARLGEAADGISDCIAVALSAGQSHPTFALWPIEVAESLHRFLDEGESRGVSAFMALHAVVTVPFAATALRSGEIDPFFNINRPEDLAEAARTDRDMDA